MPKATTDNTSKITDITTKVVKLLSDLDSEARQKVIRASMTLLGETTFDLSSDGGANSGNGGGKPTSTLPGLSPKANAWIKQNGLTVAQLEQVFDIDGGSAGVIAGSVPGKSSKDQTIAAYVLRGVAQLLATGDPTFDDKSARKLCEDLGCYNSANHAVYMNAIGNSIAGSKDKGWKLTAPGMKKGADLIKDMTKGV
jgi:hypothetical protein